MTLFMYLCFKIFFSRPQSTSTASPRLPSAPFTFCSTAIMKSSLAVAIFGWNMILSSSAFSQIKPPLAAAYLGHRYVIAPLFAEVFGNAVKDRPIKNKAAAAPDTSVENVSAEEAKRRLIDLIPRMTGKDEEYRAVEAYVNLLEDKYSPVQTIDFLNLAMSGDWQLVSIDCDVFDSSSFIQSLIKCCMYLSYSRRI